MIPGTHNSGIDGLYSMGLPASVVDAMLAEAMRQVKDTERAASNTVSYTLRNNIKAIQTMEDPELALDGPAGTGKSLGCLVKLHRTMLRNPGARALICRKTRKSLSESALFTYEQHILGAGNPVLGNPGPTRAHREKYVYPNGSEVVVGGLDNPQRILGAEYDLIYVPQAEEISQDDRDALNSRLRNGRVPWQQLLMDFNPSYPGHWARQLADAGVITMLPTRHVDNPRLWSQNKQRWTFYGKQYMSRLERLTGVRYQRLVLGKWVKAEGVVYEGFDRDVHLLPSDFDVPADWPRYLAIDFGFNNPFVCQWWARDPDGALVMYREMYVTQKLVEDCAREIARRSRGEVFQKVITDHDAEDRKTLERHLKVRTRPARKPILRGIQAVQSRFKVDKRKKSRLYFVEGALIERDQRLAEEHLPTSTLEEIESYVWKKASDGRPIRKEEPIDENNHGMDTMRYMVAEFDLKPDAPGRGKNTSHTHTNM